jgi:general secretion pathway protein G
MIRVERIVSTERKWARRGAAGFTLTELLVVLVILGLLAAIVAPRLMGSVLGGAKTKTAAAQIHALATALDIYRLDVGSYPNSESGLESLVSAPPDAEGWAGSYLTGKKVPKDPWGNPYHYRLSDDGMSYVLTSYGADNSEGGDGPNADISNAE